MFQNGPPLDERKYARDARPSVQELVQARAEGRQIQPPNHRGDALSAATGIPVAQLGLPAPSWDDFIYNPSNNFGYDRDLLIRAGAIPGDAAPAQASPQASPNAPTPPPPPVPQEVSPQTDFGSAAAYVDPNNGLASVDGADSTRQKKKGVLGNIYGGGLNAPNTALSKTLYGF